MHVLLFLRLFSSLFFIHTHTHTHTHTHRLLKLMREMFGPQNANWSREDQEKIEICVDSNTALLDPATLVVECSDDSLNHLVSAAAKRLQNALSCQS